jgi:alkylation response protein AidB-like acyl-CoA dehydrogenase
VSVLRVEQAEGVDDMEDLESFRHRARAFIRSNLRQVAPEELRLGWNGLSEEMELAAVARDRELQRLLFDAGLAGICFPRAYGGQGLTPEHQKVLNEELVGYEFPSGCRCRISRPARPSSSSTARRSRSYASSRPS